MEQDGNFVYMHTTKENREFRHLMLNSAGGRQNQKPCTQLTRQIIICMTALVRFIWHAYFIGEDVGAPLMLGLFDLLS